MGTEPVSGIGRLTRRSLLLAGGAALGYGAGRFWAPEVSRLDGVPRLEPPTDPTLSIQPLMLDDASQLMATPIHVHKRPTAHGDALVEAFRAELAAARADNRPVCVSAARHSMGGQSIPRGGHAITVDDAWIELDAAAGIYRANGGARWRDVINALDPMGFSPAVMQSNHDFGIAA
ncbi:MAG: FAD-binding protein, partial [Pseudomonadota bacterium]